MALGGTTFTVPHSGGNIVCAKVNQDGYSSEYRFRDATHEVRVMVRHSRTTARADRPSYDRHNVEIVETIFESGEVAEYQRKAYFVIEQLPSDLDVEFMDALADWAIATSNENLDDLMQWQS
jgi:hypothetical protein